MGKDAAKDSWREFICTSAIGGKFLSSIGASVTWAEQLPLQELPVQKFLSSLRRGVTDVRLLANAVDLLRPEYLAFISDDVPRLLDHLANETIRVDEIVGPGLRGNPRWDKTLLERISGQLPPGKFYSRTAHRTFSKPENQLIKWLLRSLTSEIQALERQIGLAGFPAALKTLLARTEEAARHHWLSDVATPARLTHEMLTAARQNRLPAYRLASKLASWRNELEAEVAHGKWKAIVSMLSAGWLEPINDDDLFELYALALSLEVICAELGFGFPKEVGLVSRQRDYVARFQNDSQTIDVFFDQSPSVSLGIRSRYAAILGAHQGITGAPHRPDITLVIHDDSGERRVVFVEVKRSGERGYLADSIYKAFGYIHDFTEAWSPTQKTPKVIIFVPEAARLQDGTVVPEVAFVHGQDRNSFSALLERAVRIIPEPT